MAHLAQAELAHGDCSQEQSRPGRGSR